MVDFALAAPSPACRGSVRFFDGKQLYALDFLDREPLRRSEREARLGLGEPVRCHVRYREIAGFKKKAPQARGQGLAGPIALTFARVGAAGPWVISAIDAETRWGRASVQLQSLSRGG